MKSLAFTHPALLKFQTPISPFLQPLASTALLLAFMTLTIILHLHLFIYFWLKWVFTAAQGLPPAAVSRGSSPVAVCRLLTAGASLVERGHSGCSSCRTWAQLPQSIRDLPRPGIKPVSPALPGRFLTTGLQGKPQTLTVLKNSCKWNPAVFILLWLAYFTQHYVLLVHMCCCILHNLFLI